MQSQQNEIAFSHLVESLSNPAASRANQVGYNQTRFADVQEAFRVRPAYLPITISLPAAVQTLPLSGQTNPLPYDVIVTGLITDGESKKVNFRRDSEVSLPFVSVGTESGSQINLDAIAGKSLESAGVHGIQEFMPFLLRKKEALSVDIYKPVETNDLDKVAICFVGYRITSNAFISEAFTSELQELVKDEIDKRVTPEQRFAVCPVAFADRVAEAETPKVSEPRLILGFRSTVANALVNLGFDPETKFARDFFPIWALANEAGNNLENYRMLKRPIFLEPQQQLYFSLKDSIDGTKIATDGQIEVLQQTV